MQVVIRTDDLELAGEIVQDAAAYLGVADLESTAHFPMHMQDFQAVMSKVSTAIERLLALFCTSSDVFAETVVTSFPPFSITNLSQSL